MSDEIPPSLASLQEAVCFACDCTFVPHIEKARVQVLLMPKEWVRDHILAAASQTLDPNDDWAYGRLLELLSMVCPELIPAATSQALAGSNPDIREIAVEFQNAEVVERCCREFTRSLAERYPELRAHLQSLR